MGPYPQFEPLGKSVEAFNATQILLQNTTTLLLRHAQEFTQAVNVVLAEYAKQAEELAKLKEQLEGLEENKE